MTLHRGEFEKRTSGAKSAEAESDGSEEDEVQESAALRFGLAVPLPLLRSFPSLSVPDQLLVLIGQ